MEQKKLIIPSQEEFDFQCKEAVQVLQHFERKSICVPAAWRILEIAMATTLDIVGRYSKEDPLGYVDAMAVNVRSHLIQLQSEREGQWTD